MGQEPDQAKRAKEADDGGDHTNQVKIDDILGWESSAYCTKESLLKQGCHFSEDTVS